MQQTREILRQRWVLGRSYREVCDVLGIGLGAANRAVSRAEKAGLDWHRVAELTDEALEHLIYGGSDPAFNTKSPSTSALNTPFPSASPRMNLSGAVPGNSMLILS